MSIQLRLNTIPLIRTPELYYDKTHSEKDIIMKKTIVLALMMLLALSSLSACKGETKTLTCDGCGKQVQVSAKSEMEEDWIVFCKDCEPEIDMQPAG